MLLAPAAALQGCGARPAELLPCLALAPRAQEGSLWNGASAVAVVVGQAQDGLRYLKSISLHHWLLGYEFTGEGRWPQQLKLREASPGMRVSHS